MSIFNCEWQVLTMKQSRISGFCQASLKRYMQKNLFFYRFVFAVITSTASFNVCADSILCSPLVNVEGVSLAANYVSSLELLAITTGAKFAMLERGGNESNDQLRDALGQDIILQLTLLGSIELGNPCDISVELINRMYRAARLLAAVNERYAPPVVSNNPQAMAFMKRAIWINPEEFEKFKRGRLIQLGQ